MSNADGSPVPQRSGVGVAFDCPCGCASRCYIGFSNPIDGGPPLRTDVPRWDRTGDTIETLTLHPSIQRIGGCAWHGFIKEGNAVQA